MQHDDTYQTILRPTEGLYKDKGSKFIALAFPVKTEEEIKAQLQMVKGQFHDARHHCYAWVTGFNQENHRTNDDGEPSGTAGKPILGQLNAFGLTNTLIVVVRYFGGTKLGVRGLINAYKGASIDALKNGQIVTRTICHHYRLSFQYAQMNDVMRVLKEYDLPQHAHTFDLQCELEFSVRARLSNQVRGIFESIPGVKINFLQVK